VATKKTKFKFVKPKINPSLGKSIYSEKLPFFNYALFLFILNILATSLVLLLRSNLPPEVPLLYGNPEGEDQLVPVIFLSVPGIFSLAVLIINSILAFFIKDDFVKKILMLSAFLIVVFSVITIIKIALITGSF